MTYLTLWPRAGRGQRCLPILPSFCGPRRLNVLSCTVPFGGNFVHSLFTLKGVSAESMNTPCAFERRNRPAELAHRTRETAVRSMLLSAAILVTLTLPAAAQPL